MAASEALRLLYGDLVRVLQEVELLACDLYAEGIVPQKAVEDVRVLGITDAQKRLNLLALVTDQIAVHPERLDKFVQVLKKYPPIVEVAERLEETFRTLIAQPSSQPISQCQVQPIQQPPATKPSPHPNVASEMQQSQVLSSSKQPTPIPLASALQQPPSLSAVETYAHYLKFDVYLRQKFRTYGKWPPNPATKFINLALIKKQKLSKEEVDRFTRQTIRGDIDDIVKEKQPFSMEMIGQQKGNLFPKCILVEGAPGVGKSTFAWKLCRKWSKGKLLQQYRLVVLLRLRDKRVREAKSISDLFYFYNHQIQRTVVQEIQATGGRGVFLLFEGYDELPAKLRSDNSIFLDVIKGHELPTATILVTSRPSASGLLYREYSDFIDQHVEILGFTDENIQSYLESTTSHDPSLLQGLQEYFTYYPYVRPMLYIPLNCAIVVEVYRVYKSSKTLIPKTWTDLYSSLLRSLLLRYLDDHPVSQKLSWKTNSFRDLPADVYQQLCEVSRIAYEGILQDQQVIFSDLPSDFNSLGLMQCVPELYVDKGVSKSFNFLHLTLQEYLAALHLSEQPVEKQIELFKKYLKPQLGESPRFLYGFRNSDDQSHTHFRTVVRFLAGLGMFTDYPVSSIRSLLTYPVIGRISSVLMIPLDGLHWMFEARCSNVCEALGVSLVSVHIIGGTVTSFDCFVLGYCVSHSNCIWEVKLGGCGIGDEGVTMLVRGAMEGEAKRSGHISVMDISVNKITSTGLNQLLKIPEVLKFRQLLLSSNDLGRGGAVLLLKSPLVYGLEELSLHRTGIGVEDCQALCELLSLSSTLQRIYISGNALSPEAVELIFTGLKNHSALEELNVAWSHLNRHNCILLASLTEPPRHLNLEYCHIGDEGAIEVAKLLNSNTVATLLLDGNPISVSGASVLAEKLSYNTTMVKLDLACDSIGPEGTHKMINSLAYNTTLRTVCLPVKCKSSVSTSVAYQRMKYRIEWRNFPEPLRLIETDRLTSEAPLAMLKESEDSTVPGGSTHQPHPPWLSRSLNAPTLLGHRRGTENPTSQTHPPQFSSLRLPSIPTNLLGLRRAAQAVTGGRCGDAGPRQRDSVHQFHPPWSSHMGPSREFPILKRSMNTGLTSEPPPATLEGVDSLDFDLEGWVTPPTSPQDSLCSEVEDWKTPPTSPTQPGSTTSLT